MKLRTRLLILVLALTGLSIIGTGCSLWYTHLTDVFLTRTLGRVLSDFKAAGRLEYSLVMQKGYLTYYFQDRNPIWLKELEARHKEFLDVLISSRDTATNENDLAILKKIEEEYRNFHGLRGEVIDLYRAEQIQEGYQVHQLARRLFFSILERCRNYSDSSEARLTAERERIRTRTGYYRALSLAVLPLIVALSLLLGGILIRQILGPIRRLTRETHAGDINSSEVDEVQALSRGVHHLIEDVGQTRSALEISRTHLLQSSRLASVGKLAASVAHSIRNPLTSVKMRLFSLEKGLRLSTDQREDFAVISGEIRHIDNVLRNFLEFSRKPKLKLRKVRIADVVDMAAELLGPRFESNGIEFRLDRRGLFPEIPADPDQLKESLVNIMVNASEAVGKGGEISLSESDGATPDGRPAIIITIRDNGPGIPMELADRIFEPFFSTRDNGTGLGLSITARIIEEHGGTVRVNANATDGAEFVVTLPYKEERSWT